MIKPEFKVMQMTPDKAKKILVSKNRNNRGIKASNLKKLTRAIENGAFVISFGHLCHYSFNLLKFFLYN